MSTFVWIDRDGKRHDLNTPAPIEAEASALADEKDRYVLMLDHPERMIRDPARVAIGKLQPALEQVRKDLARWNVHAVAVARTEAAVLAAQIEQLPTMIANVLLVVALHGEHDRLVAATAGAPDTLGRVLGAPMTVLQRRAIAACASREAPLDTATRGEAKEWLDAQPRFRRGDPVDGGWFGWTDRTGHAHRLSDPLVIEREAAAIARELADLRNTLMSTDAPDALYAAIDAGFASWSRLRVLQGDLERFDREATTREDTAWSTYAKDWRTKRKTS